MALIIAEHETEETEEFYRSLKEEVSGMRRELEAQRKRVLSGEEIDVTAVATTLRQLNDAVGRCFKVELSVNEIRRQRAGIAQGGYALDLADATDRVRCALHRLQQCDIRGDIGE